MQSFRSLTIIGVMIGIMFTFSGAVSAQNGAASPFGLPQDWSNRHLIYSNPETLDEAITNGTVDEWYEKATDPRFLVQVKKKERAAAAAKESAFTADAGAEAQFGVNAMIAAKKTKKKTPPPSSDFQRDWSVSLGAGFSTTLSAAMTNVQTTATVVSGTGFANNDYITIGTEILQITAGGGTTSLTVARGQLGTTAAAHTSGTAVTSHATVGAGNYPAKFAFEQGTFGSANCGNATTPDFVVYNTGLAGSGTQASIIAYDNLYSGCTGTVPSVYWQYNTGGVIITSVVLSLDGKQVAFVHSAAGGASLVLLKWSPSATLTAPTSVGAGSYRTCTAPCMTSISFSGTPNDTDSAPFYDYANDRLYAGDDSGNLHQFTGVFRGTPAENVVSSHWPAAVSTHALNSPVYDPLTTPTTVFVTDGSGGGFLYYVSADTSTGGGAGTKSGALSTATIGLGDAPVVDSSAAKAYVFSGNDGAHAAVFQLATNFGSAATGSKVEFAGPGQNKPYFAGNFDNQYYTTGAGGLYSCNENGGAAQFTSLVRIPITGGTMGTATLLSVESGTAKPQCSPVSEILSVDASTTLSAAITTTAQTSINVTSGTGFPTNDFIQVDSEIMKITAGGGTTTLTVTRAQNGTTATTHAIGATVNDIHDRMFLSVVSGGGNTGCTGACVYTYDVTGGALPGNASAGLAASGGSSGIIIDNFVPSGTFAGASQVYYSALANTAATTLSAAITTTTQTSISVTSGTGLNNNDYIKIDSEIMKITAGGGTTTLTVLRGQLNTTAATHSSGAAVNDTCGTSGASGDCAVQASQKALS